VKPARVVPRRRPWSAVFLPLAAAGLAVLASFTAGSARPALVLDVVSVPLNPSDPSQTTVGPLRFRGGLWLRSSDPRFGGLSDLRIGEDGARLIAVSDCGRGFTAALRYDAAGDLVGLGSPHLVDLAGPGGRALERSEIDAEALALDESGGLLVGFEGKPRIWRYADRPAFGGIPVPQPVPLLDACPATRGLETIASLGDGRLLLVCEGQGRDPGSCPAWIGAGDAWVERAYPLDASATGLGEAFHPTSAAVLPDGDVLVLERRFPPIGARLVRLSRADLDGTAHALSPRVVAVLEPPVTLDNFEGLSVRTGPEGETLVYLLSDDNGCAKRPPVVPPRLQRTLLLLFALAE